MANDALDPGPNGDYPFWPRNPDGTSAMPTGLRLQPDENGRTHLIDITPRHTDGTPIVPPDIAALEDAEG